MHGTGGSIGNTIGMGGGHARHGGPNLGQEMAGRISDAEMAAQMHYTPATTGNAAGNMQPNGTMGTRRGFGTGQPDYYNQFDGLPAAYTAPSDLKEHLDLKSQVRSAASAEPTVRAGAVIRTDPITEGEVQYLKSMKDQVELAQFDDYVETFIDPRKPGNMKWLMEVYPDYVNRRLQQAHTDYEFALRNQMIDSWGINTFDDLHFKYMVDQGKISGPLLTNRPNTIDMTYAAGLLSPWAFRRTATDRMGLPFTSATIGKRPTTGGGAWVLDRTNRPLGRANQSEQMAATMFEGPGGRPASAAAGVPVNRGIPAPI
jgi:hypothetical protein